MGACPRMGMDCICHSVRLQVFLNPKVFALFPTRSTRADRFAASSHSQKRAPGSPVIGLAHYLNCF